MHVLFANTGIQLLCIPLPAGRRYKSEQVGRGWNQCRCLSLRAESAHEQAADVEILDEQDGAKLAMYVQWQIVQANVSKLFLAVDTTLGDPELGCFCDPAVLVGDRTVRIGGLLGADHKPLAGLPEIELTFRAAGATTGEARPVHVVVDFGNSRTGALVLELSGEVAQTPAMLPFELLNRYSLDAFNDEGEWTGKASARWFSAKTRWCTAPYLPPMTRTKTEYYYETTRGLLGSKQTRLERQVTLAAPLFDDLSMARMGREADLFTQIMKVEGDFRTGVSSPKRYLWADDAAWLEGAIWHMADPQDRAGTREFSTKLAGPLLKFLPEDDGDALLEEGWDRDTSLAVEAPAKPRHAPRILMTAALYEMLCQIYTFVNSAGYRNSTAHPNRSREVHSLTLSYPSGMFQPERERLRLQAQKAVELFAKTLGKSQSAKPELTLSIDEASAVHLTYIWSELLMLGQDPRLWFLSLGRDEAEAAGLAKTAAAEPAALESSAASRRRSAARPARRASPAAAATIGAESGNGAAQQMRIACIDIGGGTTDLMIAKYEYHPGIDDLIRGQVLHQDGISIAGDQLVKRLLEKIVVPAFAESVGFEPEDVQLLFGPPVPKNRGFTSRRVAWMNHLFVPLAEAYLQAAVEGADDQPISHTDAELVDVTILDSLEAVCNKLRGPGFYNLQQPMELLLDPDRFEEVVHEVFDDLLFDLCGRCVDHRADVVLLAGQPTKLGYIQRLVSAYTPLPASRIIPMFNHYAGNWYPYQEPNGRLPGVIVDPKSAVVVGAAIEFLARNGFLSQFHFQMRGKESENTYFWGVMTAANNTIRPERILFAPVGEDTGDEWTEFNTIAQRVVIGRKMNGDEYAQASPIYVLKADPGGRLGPIDLRVKVRRVRATDKREEHLEFQSVTGTVAGEPASLGDNVTVKWRTLADEGYYLDTGGLDNIEVGE